MNSILNIISVVSAFLFGVGVIYTILDITLGRLKIIQSKFEWNGLQIKDFVFLILAVILILKNFTFITPY